MGTSFKQWLQMQEIVMGSDGQRDNQTVQTSKAAAAVGQQWLGDKKNAGEQAAMVSGVGNKSTLGKKLLDAGTHAIGGASNSLAAKTTAPLVANFLQTNLGLPQVLKPMKPGQQFMGKK